MPNPKKKLPTDIKSLARSYTDFSIQTLGAIAANSSNDSARVTACIHLLDRGWGRCDQPHTGPEGGDIRITIRQIMREVSAPPLKVVSGVTTLYPRKDNEDE